MSVEPYYYYWYIIAVATIANGASWLTAIDKNAANSANPFKSHNGASRAALWWQTVVTLLTGDETVWQYDDSTNPISSFTPSKPVHLFFSISPHTGITLSTTILQWWSIVGWHLAQLGLLRAKQPLYSSSLFFAKNISYSRSKRTEGRCINTRTSRRSQLWYTTMYNFFKTMLRGYNTQRVSKKHVS